MTPPAAGKLHAPLHLRCCSLLLLTAPLLPSCLVARFACYDADPLGRCGAVVMFRHQLAVLPAVDYELLALGIVGGEAEEAGMPGAAGGGPTAAPAVPAVAVGNSYVDNLGKSGVKEVGAPPCAPSSPQHVLLVVLPNCPARLPAACIYAHSRAAGTCWLRCTSLIEPGRAPPHPTSLLGRCGMPSSCTATTSRC